MNKYQQFKEAIKSPPPQRLAKVEYQSHFMQMFGVSMVSVILIVKGFWYIIFAFIFSLGVSYSQGMTAYNKYHNIMGIIGKEDPKEFQKDPSPSRRRGKIINHIYGGGAKWSSIIGAVGMTALIIPPGISRVALSFAYFISISMIYIILYYFVFHRLAIGLYNEEMKIK